MFSYCNNYCKGRHQVQLRELTVVTNEWLYEQYWIVGNTCNDIARIIGRDPKRVWEWMIDANIPVKPRGHDERQRFQKGQPSPFTGRKHSEESKRKMSDIAKAQNRVPGYGYKINALKGKRGPEVHSWKGGLTPERQKAYSTDEWKECVKSVWARDNAICQLCGKDHRDIDRKKEKKFNIHHIISFQVVDYRFNVDNLILLCYDCHRWVHSKKNKDKVLIKEINDD